MLQPRRKPRHQDSFSHQLNLYALAASAAGVGLLTGGQAEAEVVYTPAHRYIVPNHTYSLDLNHDGIPDFDFRATFTFTSFSEYVSGAITVVPARQENEAVGYAGRSSAYASALAPGALIGSKDNFLRGDEVMALGGYDAGAFSSGWCSGPWINKRNSYLGLKFTIQKETHYGWARLSEMCSNNNGENEALLTGYAYETVADRPIVAGSVAVPENENNDDAPGPGAFTRPQISVPEPASLGVLARGARGITIWRPSLE